MLTLEKSLKETDKKVWTPKRPIKEIEDEGIRNIFIKEAKYLLNDLEINYLEVELIDAKEPLFEDHKIRRAKNENPKWYRNLRNGNMYYCKNIGRRKIKRKKQFRRKKAHSYILRYRVVNALTKIINQTDKTTSNDFILREFMFGRFTKGYEEMGHHIPPNEKVCNYFGIRIAKKNYSCKMELNF